MSISGQGYPLDSVKCPSGSRLCYFNGTGSTICPSDSLKSDFRVLLFNFFLSLKVLRIFRTHGYEKHGWFRDLWFSSNGGNGTSCSQAQAFDLDAENNCPTTAQHCLSTRLVRFPIRTAFIIRKLFPRINSSNHPQSRLLGGKGNRTKSSNQDSETDRKGETYRQERVWFCAKIPKEFIASFLLKLAQDCIQYFCMYYRQFRRERLAVLRTPRGR